jgi:dihydroorotate dehydrogenase
VYSLVRPLLFALDPSLAHAMGLAALAPIEYVAPIRMAVRALCARPRPRLVTRAMGLTFPSPIGLAAGFDKNARRPRALAALGFGHIELGTVTAREQDPTPPPNLFRLPKDQALINRLGFPNDGADRVTRRLVSHGGARGVGVPVGISIGKSRVVAIDPLAPVIADYVASFRAARALADFVVVNVSSPNTKDLRALQDAALARELLSALVGENARDSTGGRRVPLLVKIAPDQEEAHLVALFAVVRELGLEGVVATNTTVSRAGLRDPETAVAAGAGGLSGPPLRARALEVVRAARRELGAGATIFGVGGVETADDVLAFIRAGANLVQIYTGFIYGGPSIPFRLAKDLDARLAALDVSGIADIVGTEHQSL